MSKINLKQLLQDPEEISDLRVFQMYELLSGYSMADLYIKDPVLFNKALQKERKKAEFEKNDKQSKEKVIFEPITNRSDFAASNFNC